MFVGGPRQGGLITYTHEYIEPYHGGELPSVKESVSAKVSMVVKEPYIPLDKLEAGVVDSEAKTETHVITGAAARRLSYRGSAASSRYTL